jgi:alpha-amylase/alpha-mannosidase (GH57 family)
MGRHLCIHGHFYQPPRENPWLEAVEIQDSAYPYHDWNERITSECYATNAASRILDGDSRIMDIVSNYSKISFNMGPTLLSWLERHAPDVYASVLDADRQSIEWRSGHGAAIAQAYNHLIMPLANQRDKRTQVIWGVRDFTHRFGRPPEGMWLPETAVDLETLDVLASQGIKFTILAPHQAKRTRWMGEGEWKDVSGSRVDPSRAYTCRLRSGRIIALFFYDAPISHAVAFERVLRKGEVFARRLVEGFSEKREDPQLVNIATDGESYGHHHRFGDMALAYAIHYIEENNLARITNYGEYLELHPPNHEVEIFENTSWSCSHGIERWRSDCGCTTGGHRNWNQAWRTPLKESLDWLRDELAAEYEKKASEYFKDPWDARDDYIYTILDRSDKRLESFFSIRARRQLEPKERVLAIKLLEMQRNAMLMYTSCGWFFADISGIETVQIMQYAGRVIQLAEEVFGHSLEKGFVAGLEAAQSNIPEHENGRTIYEKAVKPDTVNLRKVGAHFAISSLFEDYPEETRIYSYNVVAQDYNKMQSGKMQLVTGKCLVRSEITGESETVNIGVLHLGNHDINCGVRHYVGDEAYGKITGEMKTAFKSGAFSDLVRLTDKYYGQYSYSLKDLFRDEQRNLLETIIAETTEGFEASYRRMYEDNRLLMGFLQDTGIPITKAFLTAAEFILNIDLKRQMRSDAEPGKIREILDELKKWNIPPDEVGLEFAFRRILEHEIVKLNENPRDVDLLETFKKSIDIAVSLPFDLNMWMTQNIYFLLARNVYPGVSSSAAAGDDEAGWWVDRFRSVGMKLKFNLESVLADD